LWHIAEVEDNWVREAVYSEPWRFPFGRGVKAARAEQYPGKAELLDYFDVRK
jgi:hypothetical protein